MDTITQLSPRDYVRFVEIMEAAGIAPEGSHAKAEASYPEGYDGEVVSIGVQAGKVAQAAAIEEKLAAWKAAGY